MQVPELSTLLALSYPEILARYTVDYPDNTLLAKEAFGELMKFLWLNAKHKADLAAAPESPELQFKSYMQPEFSEVDDMWHTFILFTRDYMDFGKTHFGHFIHHQPTSEAEKQHFKENAESILNDEFAKWLSYVYDNLGPETLQLWFKEYLEKNDDEATTD